MSSITWAIAEGPEIQQLARWAADVIWPGKGRDFGNCQAMAVIEGEKLIAGVIFHNYEPGAQVIEISTGSISKRWLTRETLRVMFAIPFTEWNLQAVVLRVSDFDEPMHRMLKVYGFERYRIPRLRGRNEAENVFILTDDAWRANKFNKKDSANGQTVRAEGT